MASLRHPPYDKYTKEDLINLLKQKDEQLVRERRTNASANKRSHSKVDLDHVGTEKKSTKKRRTDLSQPSSDPSEKTDLQKEQDKFEALVRMTQAISHESTAGEVIAGAVPIFKQLLQAERCTLFMSDVENQKLRTFLTDVTEEIVIPINAGIAGHVVTTGKSVNIANAYDNPKFDHSIDLRTGFRSRSILCVPLLHPERGVIGAVQMVNKAHGVFTKDDERVCHAFSTAVAVALHNATLSESLELSKKRSEALLQVLTAATSGGPVTEMMQKLIESTHSILNADDVVMFLVDAKKMEIYCKITKNGTSLQHTPLDNTSVEGKCAITQNLLNIADVHATDFITDIKRHKPKRSSSVDDYTPPTPVLAACAVDRNGSTIGVIRVVGKRPERRMRMELSGGKQQLGHDRFTTEDETLLSSMTLEIARALKRRSYEATFQTALVETSQGQQHLTSPGKRSQATGDSFLSLFTKHARPHKYNTRNARKRDVPRTNGREAYNMDAVGSPTLRKVVTDAKKYLASPDFDAWACSDSELFSVIGAIFDSLHLLGHFKIPMSTFNNFLDAVNKGYRDNHYHNFRHGVTVLHGTFMIVTQGGGLDIMTKLDLLALMLGSLCHDINHYGVNNKYLVNSSDELALVYNDVSVLENMHASFTFRILAKDETNILKALKFDEYQKVRGRIIGSILATDMANHFEMTSKLKELASRDDFKKSGPENKETLMNASVHAADISGPLLRPDISIKWARAVTQEFNDQVDLERKKGLPVSAFMEARDEKALAKMNLNFIDYIISPLWNSLSELLQGPVFKVFLSNLAKNREHWIKVLDE